MEVKALCKNLLFCAQPQLLNPAPSLVMEWQASVLIKLFFFRPFIFNNADRSSSNPQLANYFAIILLLSQNPLFHRPYLFVYVGIGV